MVGVGLPVQPRKRCIFVFRSEILPDFPMLIDTSGVYVRPDGPAGQYLCGVSPPAERDPDATDDFEVDHDLFTETIWPALAARVQAFEGLRVTSSWAGHYAFNTADHNIIIGRVEGVPNFYLINGCSGHGLMHSPASGRALAELIHTGRYQTIDLTRFEYARLAAGKFIVEKNVI
jgi:FAD-dependent oxidoreductase domain-containing protein 1